MSKQSVRHAASFERQSYHYEEGIEAQYDINRRRAEADGYVIPNNREYRFSENRVSGQAKDRKEWERLVALVESGDAPFDRIYIKARPRFGRWRDPREHVYWELRFEKCGVELIYLSQERHIRLQDGMQMEDVGQYVMNILEGVGGALELKTTTDRTVTGARSRILQGFFPGGTVPYGIDRWLVNAKTGVFIKRVPVRERIRMEGCYYKLRWAEDQRLDAIRFIFERIQKGVGTHVVAQMLNERGFPTPEGVPWRANTAWVIARNPIYTGILVWARPKGMKRGVPIDEIPGIRPHTEADAAGRHPIRYDDFIPNPPVTKEEFEEAQRILNGSRELWNRRHATSPEFLLGGILKCHRCGASIHGATARQKGRSYSYYRHCRWTPVTYGAQCPVQRRSLSSKDVEAAVLSSFSNLLSGEELQRLVRTEMEARLRTLESEEHAGRVERAAETLAERRRTLEAAVRNAAAFTGEAATANEALANQLSKEIERLKDELDRLQAEGEEIRRILADRRRILVLAGRLREVFDAADLYRRKEIIAAVTPRIELDMDANKIWMQVRMM